MVTKKQALWGPWSCDLIGYTYIGDLRRSDLCKIHTLMQRSD